MNPADRLEVGLGALAVDLPVGTTGKLRAFAALLEKWNRTYNLTALRDADSVVSHHLLDSLAVLPYLACESLVDVGSGGGLPGIPLALARPEWRIALVEANHKKASFLTQAKIELALHNVIVVRERVEHWKPAHRFDCAISRAFAELARFVGACAHVVAPGGTFAAMKGVYPFEELGELPAGFAVERVIPLDVPGIAGARHLVLIRRPAS
jgi:16S rRNA (guanine527-N7)-methyltransferase